MVPPHTDSPAWSGTRARGQEAALRPDRSP